MDTNVNSRGKITSIAAAFIHIKKFYYIKNESMQPVYTTIASTDRLVEERR